MLLEIFPREQVLCIPSGFFQPCPSRNKTNACVVDAFVSCIQIWTYYGLEIVFGIKAIKNLFQHSMLEKILNCPHSKKNAK